MKNLYFPHCQFLDAKPKNNNPKFWKDILSLKNETLLNCCWDIGTPNTIRIWEDPWLPNLYYKKPMGTTPPNCNLIYVSDLLNSDKSWSENILRNNFDNSVVNEIMKINLPTVVIEKKIVWT